MSLSETERVCADQTQDKRNPTLPTNLLSSFGWAYWLTPAKALASLRETLRQLGVPEFSKYGAHALRKGHTMDMAESGEVPEEVLLYYGQWKSKTSMRPYLDESIAERNRVARAHAAMPDEVPVCPPPDGDLEGSSSDDDLGWGRQLE